MTASCFNTLVCLLFTDSSILTLGYLHGITLLNKLRNSFLILRLFNYSYIYIEELHISNKSKFRLNFVQAVILHDV